MGRELTPLLTSMSKNPSSQRLPDDNHQRWMVVLNPKQEAVLKMVMEKKENIFFMGSAGAGKSLLLRAIITTLKKKYSGNLNTVTMTASTGMAVNNIGGVLYCLPSSASDKCDGMTIHSWGAISLRCICHCKPALDCWTQAQVLIVDEGGQYHLVSCSSATDAPDQCQWSGPHSSSKYAKLLRGSGPKTDNILEEYRFSWANI
ncbi:hypothetical protein C8J57DRAFT_1250106 [Mycena rebaudengoi]|nr:hypothetical protein C8J57DRAFT_1250106 [Mycena rebaudengoi]